MPVPFNLLLNVLFGGAVAVATRHAPAHKRLLAWPLLFALFFEGAVFTPLATYCLRFFPDWSRCYAFHPRVFSNLFMAIGPLSALAIAANFGALFLGFTISRHGLNHHLPVLTWAPIVGMATASTVLALLLHKRLFAVGDFDAFWNGTANPILQMPPGYATVGLLCASCAFVVWMRLRFGHHDPTLL